MGAIRGHTGRAIYGPTGRVSEFDPGEIEIKVVPAALRFCEIDDPETELRPPISKSIEVSAAEAAF